ncbi:MAG: 2Fe-2S iron-sulfur cluster-binding protein [Algoriphagus sp.]|uniref:2Fe-2S iron-sulfur cluster-binding protein n=1 Tax=Algoriphagus sp. TaxID=1872435 RepID=UPI00273060E2|nr:2Fe-2S iron-sulfur cluster-binding protein [Algoriphagus sp.]MDP2042763.1 2Fe-2S iron-sulfur cluster-binding protein [Algoriphagus sp.]MDP3470861.1 2Fe-2S iron-sulfur cluster-binding protein [Algoriphagus sp.]
MPRIVIENLRNLSIYSEDTDRKVIEIIHENGTDWMHACGKKGRCTTCKMIVVRGMENLSPETERELVYRSQNRLRSNERLSCQSQVLKDELIIRVADVNKLPHIDYTK